MPLIQWSDELSVAIDSIDQQHKTLVAMINKLNDAFEAEQTDQVLGGIFEQLSDYTIKHFAYEETLFAQYDYPQTQEHQNEHRVLVQQVKELQKKMQNGDFMVSVELMVFFKEWLLHHILQTDKAYAQFFLGKGVS